MTPELLQFEDLTALTGPAPGAQQTGSNGSEDAPRAGAQVQPPLDTLDVQTVARRAFALLAFCCLSSDPASRPSFADIAAKLEIIRRALMAQPS
jgi:hypothetical protein